MQEELWDQKVSRAGGGLNPETLSLGARDGRHKDLKGLKDSEPKGYAPTAPIAWKDWSPVQKILSLRDLESQ